MFNKNKTQKIKQKELISWKKKLMDKDFEQNHYSRTAKGIYKVGYASLNLVKWMAYDHKDYKNIN